MSSLQAQGPDNAVAAVVGGGGKENPALAADRGARGARALGDIGNRLRKNLGTTASSVGAMGPLKPALQPKPTKAAAAGALENRPPATKPAGGGVKVAAAMKAKEGSVGVRKGLANASANIAAGPIKTGAVGGKVLGNVQNRTQTQANLKAPEVVKKETQAAPKLTVYEEVKTEVKVKETLAAVTVEADPPPSSATEETDVEKGKEVVAEGFSAERFQILDIDTPDSKNPFLLRDYVLDICDYLFKLEKKYPVKLRYLEGRLVNSKMRAVLLDWLVEVHYQFGFLPETLYIASKTLDRYLQKERKITRKQLQLVGVTAMYIAAKFEEVCTPTVTDFSAVSDNAFSASEVRQMEREILQSLEFDLSPPPAIFFLRRFSKAAGVRFGMASMAVHSMAKYIMELTLVDYSTCHLFPSEQAAASLALASLVMDKTRTLKEVWTPTLEHYSAVSLSSLKNILVSVTSALAKYHEEPMKLKAVFSKYSRTRMNKISLVPELKVEAWRDRVVKQIV